MDIDMVVTLLKNAFAMTAIFATGSRFNRRTQFVVC